MDSDETSGGTHEAVKAVHHSVPGNGATHHVIEWCKRPPGEPHACVLLLHGFMDAAGTWDLVAAPLAAEGFRVLAPDLRGFGEGPRVPSGSYYHFADYVFDIADLVLALVPPDCPLFVVGHSMGGTVATLFAGTFPERVARLALVEGVGPPDDQPATAPDRMRRWVDGVRSVRARNPRSMPSHDEALRRLLRQHPAVPEAVLRTRVAPLVDSDPGGRIHWKADPLHGTHSPSPFYAATWKAFARRVTCPVVFVSGGPTGWHPADEADRLACFGALSRVELPNGGHMLHWTMPERLARALGGVWRAPDTRNTAEGGPPGG